MKEWEQTKRKSAQGVKNRELIKEKIEKAEKWKSDM